MKPGNRFSNRELKILARKDLTAEDLLMILRVCTNDDLILALVLLAIRRFGLVITSEIIRNCDHFRARALWVQDILRDMSDADLAELVEASKDLDYIGNPTGKPIESPESTLFIQAIRAKLSMTLKRALKPKVKIAEAQDQDDWQKPAGWGAF